MIPAEHQIWIVAGVTDMRRGFTGLSAMVQTVLQQNPLSGQVSIFRGREATGKNLWHDGDGLCLFQKRLDRGRFVWPQATSGTVSLTRAQLSMLCEGIDWRHPAAKFAPPWRSEHELSGKVTYVRQVIHVFIPHIVTRLCHS